MTALAKLQRICKERQVRFESFFDMFDRLHSKKISKAEFERALSIAGVKLSQSEVAELCDAYESGQFPDKIRYLALCDDVNSVFTIKGLEAHPPSSPMSTTSLSRQAPMMGVQTQSEIADVQVAKEFIRHQALVNGVVVKNFFKDYDHNNCGCIPLEEFVRACNSLDSRISSAAALALAKAYTQLQPNGMTLVNYRCIHDDCTDDSVFAGAAINRLTRNGMVFNEMKNPEAPHWWQQMAVGDMEDQLATAMAQLRLGRSTAFGFFLSQDKYRCGSVPLNAFKRGCKDMFTGVPFTEDMFDVIVKTYPSPGGKVNYHRFLERLYSKLGRFGVVSAGGGNPRDNSPTKMKRTPGWGDSARSQPPGFRAATSGETDDGQYDALSVGRQLSNLSQLSSTSSREAVPQVTLLGNHLQNSAHGIKIASPLRLKNKAFHSAAVVAMMSTTKVGFGGEALKQQLHKPGLRNSLGLGVGSSRTMLSEVEEEQLEVVLERIREQVATRRIDLKWKLQDYDTKSCSTATQHEHITTNQFARGLSELNLLSVPPDAEVRLLATRFAPADGRHEPLKYVNYRAFLVDVDITYSPSLWSGSLRLDGESSLTQGQPRKDPLKAQLEMLKIRPSTTVGGPNRGTKVLLADVVEHCKAKRVRLDDFFRDGDALRHGVLPRHKFRVGLSSAGCSMSEAEFLSLSDAFKSAKAKDPKGDAFVDWAQFMRVVRLGLGEGDDAVDTTFRRSRTAHLATPLTLRTNYSSGSLGGGGGGGKSGTAASSFLGGGGGGGTEAKLTGGAVSWGWGGGGEGGEEEEKEQGGSRHKDAVLTRQNTPFYARSEQEDQFSDAFGDNGEGGDDGGGSQAATGNRGDLHEEFVTAEALEEVSRLCVAKRLDSIHQAFQDFDHQNRGFVSAGVFDRVLALCGVRPALPHHMKGLLQKFADQTPDSRVDVNYKAFADAVAKVVKGDTDAREVATASEYRAMTKSRGAGSGGGAGVGGNGNRVTMLEEYDRRTKVLPPGPLKAPAGGVEGVLAELCVQLRAKRGRLLDFFKDGDTLGTGELSQFKFRSALGRAGLSVDDPMFKQLVEEFGSGKRQSESVDWRAFHKALNATKEMMGMYSSFANVQSRTTGGAGATAGGARAGGGGDADGGKWDSSTRGVGFAVSGAPESETEDLLDAICDLVSRRRILVKPFFQDLDRCNANQVTKAQMGSVLSQNVGISLSEQERDTLFDAFCVCDIKGNATNRFDYKKFVKRVDAVEVC